MAKAKSATTEKIRELFGVAPKEFVKRRDALASELKAARRADDAKEVKALKKPGNATYLVNLVAHRFPADVKAMLAAGDAVEKAQRSGKTADLHERSAEHRALIASLLDRAEEIAKELGVAVTRALRSKVETTFRAATLDDENRAAVETGTLTGEIEEIGFDALFASGGIRAPKASTVSARTAKQSKAVDASARKAAERQQKRAKAEAERELERAKRKQADLEDRAAKLQRDLAASTTKLERAKKKLADVAASSNGG